MGPPGNYPSIPRSIGAAQAGRRHTGYLAARPGGGQSAVITLVCSAVAEEWARPLTHADSAELNIRYQNYVVLADLDRR